LDFFSQQGFADGDIELARLTQVNNKSDFLEGKRQLSENKAGEILAEELLQAQNALAEITGSFSADDLLGEIFSGFCIGK